MKRSGSDVSQISELVDLADLAGIKGPGDTMRILMELVLMGVPPKQVVTLVRQILLHKYRALKSLI